MEVTNQELDEHVEKQLTFGQKAVSLNFNPSNDDKVGQVKQQFAIIIDTIGDPSKDTEKRSYMYSIIRTNAINTCITCCMLVIKFITWED